MKINKLKKKGPSIMTNNCTVETIFVTEKEGIRCGNRTLKGDNGPE
jgi:hypothetical protein